MNPTVSFAILSLESWVLSQEKTMTTFHTGANMSMCLQIPYRKRIRSYFQLYLTWAPEHRSNRALNIQWHTKLMSLGFDLSFQCHLMSSAGKGPHTTNSVNMKGEACLPPISSECSSLCLCVLPPSGNLLTCLIISGLNNSGVWRDILWTQHIPPDVTPLSPPKMWQWRVSIKANGPSQRENH